MHAASCRPTPMARRSSRRPRGARPAAAPLAPLLLLLAATASVTWGLTAPSVATLTPGRAHDGCYGRPGGSRTRLHQTAEAPSRTARGAAASSTSNTGGSVPLDDADEIQALCRARNLPLERVKNARDLASAATSSKDRPTPIRPGRLFRMGRPSDATEADVALLMEQLGLHTLVDLRSPTELKEDRAGVTRPDVFAPFADLVWKEASRVSAERNRRRDGCVRELPPGEFPVKRPFWSRLKHKRKGVDEDDASTADDAPLCDAGCEDPEFSLPADQVAYQNRRERHFVSLMNELKYVKGTLGRVRKRDTLKAVLQAPGALVSSRVRTKVKEPFLRKINDGGLLMLNELLLRYGAPGIKYVLELCADRRRHPVGFYCTAGKDRTGMIAAIILSLCGVPREDIVRDYSLSANVYAEMNDHQAMVGALSQRSLDPKTFLGAPAEVMRDTLDAIDREYGSVEGYCTWIGFGPEKQEQLRRACMEED